MSVAWVVLARVCLCRARVACLLVQSPTHRGSSSSTWSCGALQCGLRPRLGGQRPSVDSQVVYRHPVGVGPCDMCPATPLGWASVACVRHPVVAGLDARRSAPPVGRWTLCLGRFRQVGQCWGALIALARPRLRRCSPPIGRQALRFERCRRARQFWSPPSTYRTGVAPARGVRSADRETGLAS